MKKLGFVITSTLLGLSISAFAAPKDLTGTYICKGYDSYAKANFTTTMTLQATAKNVYRIFEQSTSTKSVSDQSIALQSGELLAVAYQYNQPLAANNNATFGVQAMKISNHGKTISGPWVDYQTNVPGTETCTKISSNVNS